jgi:cytochrome c
VGGGDGRLRVLDIAGEVLAETAVVETPVIALAVSADGKLLAAAGLKGAIAVLDAATLRPVHHLVGPGLPVWSLAFTTDGKFLLTGGADRLVRRWDMATGEHVGAIMASPADPLAQYTGDRDAEVFRACVACHTLAPGEGERAGPTLHGIFGRRIASVAGYNYSAAFRDMDIVWTPETVSKLFEVGPATFHARHQDAAADDRQARGPGGAGPLPGESDRSPALTISAPRRARAGNPRWCVASGGLPHTGRGSRSSPPRPDRSRTS